MIIINNNIMVRIATNEEQQQMINYYLQGNSMMKSAEKCGFISQGACRNALIKHGIKIRQRSFYRKHTLNQDYFSLIDTEKKAYWLGFITGDGSIKDNKTHKSLSIGLQLRDKKHLEKFKKDIEYSGKITVVRKIVEGRKKMYEACFIVINSKKLIEDLKKLGLHKYKFKTIKPCPIIPLHLLKHYWRGHFDADGYFSKEIKGNRINWNMGVTGSIFMIQGYKDYMNQFVNSKAGIRKPKKHIDYTFNIKWSGTKLPKNIANILYKDAIIYLDRKMETYKQLITVKDWHYKNSHITKEILEKRYLKIGNWYDVARSFNIPTGSMYQLRVRHKVEIGW